jgi:hypothetical protein
LMLPIDCRLVNLFRPENRRDLAVVASLDLCGNRDN